MGIVLKPWSHFQEQISSIYFKDLQNISINCSCFTLLILEDGIEANCQVLLVIY